MPGISVPLGRFICFQVIHFICYAISIQYFHMLYNTISLYLESRGISVRVLNFSDQNLLMAPSLSLPPYFYNCILKMMISVHGWSNIRNELSNSYSIIRPVLKLSYLNLKLVFELSKLNHDKFNIPMQVFNFNLKIDCNYSKIAYSNVGNFGAILNEKSWN